VRQLLICLAGHPEAVLAKEFLGIAESPVALLPPQHMPDVGHPTGGSFDKTETQAREPFWNPIMHQITEGKNRQHPIMRKGMVALDIEELHQIAAA
jgi:hypothetical protein